MSGTNGKASGFNGQQFTDSCGDVWTVRPSVVEPGFVDVFVDMGDPEVDEPDAGNLALSIPAGDVDQLTSRLTAAALVAGRKAEAARIAAKEVPGAEDMARYVWPDPQAAPVKPACDGTCGDQCDGGAAGVDLFANTSDGPAGQVVS